MEININPKAKLFRWGPIDGLPIYPDYWYRGMPNFSKEYSPGWSPQLTYSSRDKIQVVCDYKHLYANGEKVFGKYILDEKKIHLNYRRWQSLLKDFNDFVTRDELKNLKKLSNDDLANLFLEWNEFYGGKFWNIGSLPEVANWGGEKMLAGELKKKIKGKEDFHLAFERLSAPENLSFYQKEELDLFKIKLIKNKAEQLKRIVNHQKKYFWLLNSYHGTKILPLSYFVKRLNFISAQKAKEKIREFNNFKRKAVKDKEKIVKEFKLPNKILDIGRKLSFCVWWQDFRKSYIWRANHIIDLFFREVSKRFKVGFNALHLYAVWEVENLVSNNIKLPAREIKARKNNFLLIWDGRGNVKYVSGERAGKMFKPYLKIKAEKNIGELRGIVVSRGKAKGAVKIISSPKKANKMKKGDILVTTMTSPDYILALKKAAAVVTDAGGMTCHAAIVSRELGIPGIVGARIATKVLKDGDLVEVDANKGIVKILNNLKK